MIDTHRLDPVTYSILVLWLNGSYTTSQIASGIGISEGRVRAAYRVKAEGGLLAKRRQFLTRGERQHMLDHLRRHRMDGGRFNKASIFTAHPITDEPTEPIEPPSDDKREAKRQRRIQAQEALQLADRAVRERTEAVDGYNTKRGINADPLEWLNKERLLGDPEHTSRKSLDKHSSEMRRHESSLRIRQWLDDAQISGFKEVNYEVGSGGGNRDPIFERYLIASSSLRDLQAMMRTSDYRLLETVIRDTEFCWETVSDRESREMVFEGIRRGLDVVALYLGMMEERSFKDRWDEDPILRKARSRDEVRDTIQAARELVREGTRN